MITDTNKGMIDPATLSAALIDVMDERWQQEYREGFSTSHDDSHQPGELAGSASAYAVSASAHLLTDGRKAFPEPPPFWCFDAAFWKPTSPRRDLVKAAALILAEIERIDRAAVSQ